MKTIYKILAGINDCFIAIALILSIMSNILRGFVKSKYIFRFTIALVRFLLIQDYNTSKTTY